MVSGVQSLALVLQQKLLWGDLHAGQNEMGCGCGSLDEHYRFGRECAGLKFITNQANDHYVTQDDWVHTREVTIQHQQDGVYVPFLGCEWSPLTKDGGDRNVYYRHDEPVLRRSDRFFIEEPADPEPDIPTAPEFHDAFRDREVLVNIHVGGRMTNLEWHEPKIEKLCETHSTHGTVEWFFMDALARGYKVGLTAGTDGVMGRPGADHPGRRLIRNCKNGLTAVYAESITADAIWDALQRRCCYATTGERIRVWFEVAGQPMGSEVTVDGPVAGRFEVLGTEALDRVELFRGTEVIQTWQVAQPSNPQSRLRVLWGGTERKGTARLQKVTWDGGLTVAGAVLSGLRPVNFVSIEDTYHWTDNAIEWVSKTAGNTSGFEIVCSDLSPNAKIQFNTGPLTFDADLNELFRTERTMDAGGVNRFVRIGPALGDFAVPFDPIEPFQCNESFRDEAPLAGTQPYWIRVTQLDQSKAWSSPVYVTT